jgi:hypothetical protein
LDEAEAAAIGEGPKRFPVVARINGFSWRTTVTRMHGEFHLGLNRDVRASAGVEAGDTISIVIELDTAPREVDVPEALAGRLAGDAVARSAFENLSYTHRKEYARWVAGAKHEETRTRRVDRAIKMLREGKTRN